LANLIQGVFAAMIGLILGYTAMEYSIFWSIALHIANNFLLGVVLNRTLALFGTNIQLLLFYLIHGIFLILTIIILIMKRTKIKAYKANNKTKKGRYVQAFTSGWMVIFLIVMLIAGISGIERIS
jgi:cytochrome b561